MGMACGANVTLEDKLKVATIPQCVASRTELVSWASTKDFARNQNFEDYTLSKLVFLTLFPLFIIGAIVWLLIWNTTKD
jgi:hypothetical protein